MVDTTDDNAVQMKVIFIKGGKLIFDEQETPVVLKAYNILITEGGTFEVLLNF